MATFAVQADIEYLDGTLAGMVIPAGFRVTHTRKPEAMRTVRFLRKVCDTNDFVRAAVTGNRYRIVGHIELHRLGA